MARRARETLLELLRSRDVVTLEEMGASLDGASRATVFRHLKDVPYRRSYNHNGRYYALHEPSSYDRLGLFSRGGVHFSKDITLGATVRRLVREAEAGHTHAELQELLRVRVQTFLLDAVRKEELSREKLATVFVYLHVDESVRREQLHRRRERLAAAGGTAEASLDDVSDQVVIQVLLALIHHPGSGPAEITRRLRGHAPPITSVQVQAVFTRYDLGEKGGPSKH